MISKSASPFYPGHPVPVELFVGRNQQIERVLRAIRQTEAGKPQAVFLTGEYGIGKSSFAGFMKYVAERDHGLFGIHVFLGGAESLDDVAQRTVESAIRHSSYEQGTWESVRDAFAKYVGNQSIFGVNINLEALKVDAPGISNGYLPFLTEMLRRLEKNGYKGIFLILDEINGIAKNPNFAHFIKQLNDANALSTHPLPLLLMLCGMAERRSEMIKSHQPVERIFDIVEIAPMSTEEMKDFFIKAFGTQEIRVDDEAMDILCKYSAGFPKIMHEVGDQAYWANEDMLIDEKDAYFGAVGAAESIGKKYLERNVLDALKRKDYHSTLTKLGMMSFDLSFQKSELEKELSPTEKGKFNNFLQRLKKLNVLVSGNIRGEYVFVNRMVKLYIMLKAVEAQRNRERD